MSNICHIYDLLKASVDGLLFYLCPLSGVLLSVEVAVSEEPPLPQAEIQQTGHCEEEKGDGAGLQLQTEGQSGEGERGHTTSAMTSSRSDRQ